jgi:drug/metabolite transporter (DMT)-like permease
MLNFILYATAALIWGSTWLGIKLQLTQVPPVLSVGYRFCLASLILAAYCLVRKKRLAFSRRDHFFMAIQGFSLFGLGYCMSYLSTASGWTCGDWYEPFGIPEIRVIFKCYMKFS